MGRVFREDELAGLAQGLKPFVLPWFEGAAAEIAVGGGGDGLSAHALNGAYHSGVLSNAQAPQFLLVNGSRQLTGNLGVGAGVTVDGVDISAHAADANAHHTRKHDILSTSDHEYTGGANLDVFGLSAANTLAKLTPSSNPGAAAALLRSDSAGGLTVEQLATTNYVRTPEVRATGDLTLDPAGGDVFLPADRRLGTSTFVSGFTGSGARYETTTGATALEVDNIIVRGRMRVYELLIAQIRATNGSVLIANAGKANAVSGSGPYTVTIEPAMVFANGDIIRAQRFTGTGVYVCMGTVSGVSGLQFTLTLAGGSDAPAAGMEFVRLGSTSDASRRGSIYLTADETYAPYLDVLGGIDAASDWGTAGVIKVRLGRLDGITGGTNEYGLWAAGANAGDHLRVSPAAGVELVMANAAVTINDTTGITIAQSTTYNSNRAYRFTDSVGTLIGGVRAYGIDGGSPSNGVQLWSTVSGTRPPSVFLLAEGSATYDGLVSLIATGSNDVQILMNSNPGSVAITGNTGITGTLDVSGALTLVNGTLKSYDDTTPLLLYNGTNVAARFAESGGAYMQLGHGATENQNVFIDLVSDTTYTDYGLRLVRNNAGANAESKLSHRGTGNFVIEAIEAAAMYFQTSDVTRIQIASDGPVGIGVTPGTARLRVGGSIAAGGDDGGQASYVTLTNVTSGVSTGTGAVKMNSANAGNSTGWLKIYVAGDARYIPYWSNIAP